MRLNKLMIGLVAGIMVIATIADASAFEVNDQQIGTVVGGVAGGVLGSQVGGGRGKTLATVAGALGGAYVGGNIGHNKDVADAQARQAYYQPQPQRVVYAPAHHKRHHHKKHHARCS